MDEVDSEVREMHFHATVCAICGRDVPSTLLYAANFKTSDLSPEVFSARRLPDRVHYRMVRCLTCGLVRADPVADSESLGRLYAESTFDYASEVDQLTSTYNRYLRKLRRRGGRQQSILEVGCGNGFFLEEALRQGYSEVRGVEPSSAAIEAARDDIRPNIVHDVMRPGLFQPGQFDAVCLFQVFDHLPAPGMVLDACLDALRPGGLLLCLNHDVLSWTARLMRERSPIIDIEHPYLYGRKTMARIISAHGFSTLEEGPVYNTVSARYLAHLMPLPRMVKLVLVGAGTLGRINLRVPLGNLYVIAEKPV